MAKKREAGAEIRLNEGALALLAEDRIGKALALTWQAIEYQGGCVDWYAWAVASGIPEPLVRFVGAKLFMNGICRQDGTTAPEALAILDVSSKSTGRRRETTDGPHGRTDGSDDG